MNFPLALSTWLLDIHDRSGELDYRQQQQHVFTGLQALVALDAGLLAYGYVREGVPSSTDAWLFNRPLALMEDWAQIKQQDQVALLALSNPGRTFNVDVEGPVFDGSEEARAHCRKWGIAHVLCTAIRSEKAGLFAVMSVYRKDPAHPFSEEERQCIEAVVPHVFSSTRRARINQLRRSTWAPNSPGQCYAILSTEGVVLEAEPSFPELVGLIWKHWMGPQLPEELWKQLQGPKSARLRLGNLVVRVDPDPVSGLKLISVRRAVIADSLTEREREIAQAFSLGDSYKEVGSRFGISPNTVRRHLTNIYEKLGISSKVELDRMISGIQ